MKELIEFLNSAYMPLEEKQTCYLYVSNVKYMNDLNEYFFKNTGEVPICSKGNPFSNISFVFFDKELLERCYKSFREQIMQEDMDQSMIYVTALYKTTQKGKCSDDNFITCCTHECNTIKSNIFYLFYETIEQLESLTKFSESLKLKKNNANILFVQVEELKELDPNIVKTIKENI